MDRTRLARELVRASLAFYDRALWRRIPNAHIVALRVPGEELPLFASIMGNEGQEFGMCLYRGPNALGTLREMFAGGNRDELVAAWDLVSVSFEPTNHIEGEFAAVLREAKFSGSVAPLFMAKEPGKRVRPTRRAENELLLCAVAGVLAAKDAGLLRPVPFASGGYATVWTLTLGDRSASPGVRAKFERFAMPSPVPAAGPVLLPDDVKKLRLTDARWLVSAPMIPAGVEGDDRVLHAILVVDAGRDKILKMTATLGIDPGQVASEFFAVCRGSNALGTAGLPARVDFDQRELYAALAPALAEAGVDTQCLASLPLIANIVRQFSADIAGDQPDTPPVDVVPAAADLDAWKRLDAYVARHIAELVMSGDSPKRAAKEYFGPDMEVDQDDEEAVATGFTDWLMLHYRASARKRTLAERQLASGSLPAGVQTLLAARAASVPGLYRITEVIRGEGVVVLDVLTGRSAHVHDRALSETAPHDATLFARVYPAGSFWFLVALSGPLPPDSEAPLAWLERQGLELTPEGLARAPHLLGRLWSWRAQRRRNPPRITNTDGDALLDVRASFGVDDAEVLRAALRRREDVRDLQGDLLWVRWKGDEATHLARFEFVGDELVASLNSEARLARLQEWLLTLPGVHARSVTRRDFRVPVPDDQLREPGASEPLPPDVYAAVRATLRARIRGWLDERIPALGGKTPREAVRTADGRRQVARMIRSMPDPDGPHGRIRDAVPREEMLRELGLDGEEDF